MEIMHLDDSYHELGLAPGSSDAEVKAAWRRLSARWHPDRNDSPQALRKMQRINWALKAIRQARAEPAPAPDAAGQTMHREACEKAVDELHKLPGDQKEVLLLRIVQGMTLREIGEVTGLTPGNAAYRIDQGLRELARRLRAAGVV